MFALARNSRIVPKSGIRNTTTNRGTIVSNTGFKRACVGLVGFFVIGGTAGGAYYYYTQNQSNQHNPDAPVKIQGPIHREPTSAPSTSTSETPLNTATGAPISTPIKRV